MITAAVSTTGNAEELFEALTLAGALPVSAGVESDGAEWSVALVDLRRATFTTLAPEHVGLVNDRVLR